MTFMTDVEAIQRALAPDFPDGCDVWADYRLVGRICGPSCTVQVEAVIAA